MTIRLAIVGRPNVGKSTLFNRLTGRKLALVDDQPGVTRDYQEGYTHFGDLDLTLIDTAGLDCQSQEGLPLSVRKITEQAVNQSDICLFMIDARSGVLSADNEVADYLRRQNKPIILAANKCEGNPKSSFAYESYSLGLGEPLLISAEHGEGMGELIQSIQQISADVAPLNTSSPINETIINDSNQPLRIAFVGRPNSGKSSLINRIICTDRLLTGPTPGVTRDSISIHTDWDGLNVRIHDTAGLRRKAKISNKIEKLSVADSLRSVRFAEIVVVVLDSKISFESQDVRIADMAEREGRSVVLAINKWDLISKKRQYFETLNHLFEKRLPNLRGAELIPVSALTGYGLNNLKSAVGRTWEIWNRRVSTGQLNRWLEEMKSAHPPPAPQGRRIRLRYMTQVKSRPPSFVIMCSRPRDLPTEYLRFLKNGLREDFGLKGVPIRILLRSQSKDNPYI